MSKVYGNITGLKPNQLSRIERIYRKKILQDQIITHETARYISELSFEIGRQIGILANRRGEIEYVIVGDMNRITFPDIKRRRTGLPRLSGLRSIHTHLKGESFSQEDLTYLAILKLDLITAICVDDKGIPEKYYIAHLLPKNDQNKQINIMPPIPSGQLDIDFSKMIKALEEEFSRGYGGLSLEDTKNRAILVNVTKEPKDVAQESMDELEELAHSAGFIVVHKEIQHKKEINPRILIGKGKAQELLITSMQLGVNVIIFENNLTPVQVKNLSDFLDIKILDRTQLILEIFAKRAVTQAGKIQVELAQLKYLLPRLIKQDSSFSRLAGGIGGRRGPGETKLESDRRRVKARISHLEKEIKQLRRERMIKHSRRLEKDVPIVSLVGYTNAGKSTLLNALTNSHVLVDDLYFATLDPVSRRIKFPRDREVVINDTVGFIRDLPDDLMEAFRATLEELESSDLIIHVVDISNIRYQNHIKSVELILEKLELNHIPRILVFNKKDKVDLSIVENLCKLHNAVAISAIEPYTCLGLIHQIEEICLNNKKEFLNISNN